MPRTVVIIPTYNESGNIAGIVGQTLDILPDARVLVVDDNSPDGTAALVRELEEKDARVSLLLRERKEGLGKAYLAAFKHALKDQAVTHVAMMDADFSHDPNYLPAMQDASREAGFVIGSRYAAGGATEGWEPWRMMLSRFGNLYCRLVTGMPVNDATAGFNLISADLLRALDFSALDSSGYAFQMELKHLLWKRGTRFAEVPIVFKNRREGESKLSNHIIAEGMLAPWKMRFKKL